MNNTILTLVIDWTGKSVDLELPGDVPLNEVLGKALPGLEEWGPYPFSEKDYQYVLSDGGQQWKQMDIYRTLNEQGAQDGFYLRMEKNRNFSTSN
ncbi:hypothetical protein [Paenibacillus sp.]|jgi:hypothetical protein|uniref:hypothetical protein n=1 Tax=Paenibacillus sp. TaxID=58172 RepID=UPI00283341AE|nr:hypothetical protein [Paenibacillus sp.]MDR0268492.1 EsaB/YukD family protein [Paenibacillus sp.]